MSFEALTQTIRRRFSSRKVRPSFITVQIPQNTVSASAAVEDHSPTSPFDSPVEENEIAVRPFNTMEGLCAEMHLPYPPTQRGTTIEIHEVVSSATSFCFGEVMDFTRHEYPETALRKVRRRASSAVVTGIRKLSGGAGQLGRRASQALRLGLGVPALAKVEHRTPLDLDEMRDGLRTAVAGSMGGNWVESVEAGLNRVETRIVD
jgi:hypothetical protein